MAEENRRHHRRFHLALPLWVGFGKKAQGRAEAEDPDPQGLPEGEETTTFSISSGGCFFYVIQRPPLGAPATMRVEIPMRGAGRGGRVLCKGSVVWVSDRIVAGKTGVACTIDSFTFEPPGEGSTGE